MPDLLQRLDRFPPCLCRVIARDGRGRKLTSRQIAKRGGIDRATVNRTARRLGWRGVQIEIIDGYLYGCRINIFQMRRHVQYIKRLRESTVPISNYRLEVYFKRLNRYVGAKAKAQKKTVG